MASPTRKKKLKQLHSISTRLAREDIELLGTEDDAQQTINEIFGKKKFSKGKEKQAKPKGRKELRKEKRLQAKAKQNKSWMKKHGVQGVEEDEMKKQQNDKKKKKKKKKRKQPDESDEDELAARKREMDAANEEDDRIIAKMEKKLGLKKKKRLPTSFDEDGLGYLLELCEPLENTSSYMIGGDELDSEGEESNDEPEARPSKRMKTDKNSSKKDRITESKPTAKARSDDDLEMFSDDEADSLGGESSLDEEEEYGSNEEDFEQEEEEEEEEEAEEEEEETGPAQEDHDKGKCEEDVDEKIEQEELSDIEEDEEDEEEQNTQETKKENKALKFKKQPGNFEKQSNITEPSKYVPPHLRRLDAGNDSEQQQKLERLKKQLKGLINRLSEANLSSIAQEIEQIYSTNSRNDCNTVLMKLVLDACVMPTHMPDKMLMEHMMLVAILHAHIGNEVGAFFIQELAQKFTDLHADVDKLATSKECDNVLLLIAQLYNFKVIDSLLIYDLIRELVASFTERDIEMLMLLLKSCGAEIRRDDPASLKEIILQVQAKAASMSDLTKQSRVRFMLEVITALRNNNLRKIPQYDPSVVERARKVLKAIIRNKDSIGDMQLRISLKDLLQAKDKGRWWIVGSAWTGRDDDENMTSHKESNASGYGEMLKIAKQQRMNTEVRKNIFCVIMTSEDYLDCFEKLVRLNLKDKQAREIVHVLIDCCLQEKSYNPYYAFLAQKLCEFSRGNQVTFQYSFWDRFKTISTSNKTSCENMAKLLAHLFASGALSLSILKVVGFATIDKPSIKFFLRLFTILMREYPENTMKSVFSRIASLPKLSMLREGLKIFLRHFLLSKNTSEKLKTDQEKLKELVEIAEAALDGREVPKF